MINIVISVLDENISNLKRTLNSIGDTESVIVGVVPDSLHNIYPPDEVRKFCSNEQQIVYIRSGNGKNSTHMKNFYEGLHSNFTKEDIITFVKSGDYFCGSPHLSRIETIFKMCPNVMVICGRTQTSAGVSLYSNDKLNLQGKFFKRQFIDYYTFMEDFVNEIEFALNLHYISEVKNNIIEYIDEVVVYINNTLANVGEACQHYFDTILPYQDFFNNALTIRYIYNLMTECYFSYIEAVNLDMSPEGMEILLQDIHTFYLYFRQLELTDVEELIQVYNQGILTRYGMIHHPFTRNIPSLHLIQFLEMLEENVTKNTVNEE